MKLLYKYTVQTPKVLFVYWKEGKRGGMEDIQ